jgi:hypothetical protein
MVLRLEDDGLIQQLLDLLPKVVNCCEQINNNSLTSEWYDLEACFKLRGVGHFSTFQKNRFYQPKGGIPDAMIQGRKAWHKTTVEEWMKLTDEQLLGYHHKYHTGARKK